MPCSEAEPHARQGPQHCAEGKNRGVISMLQYVVALRGVDAWRRYNWYFKNHRVYILLLFVCLFVVVVRT